MTMTLTMAFTMTLTLSMTSVEQDYILQSQGFNTESMFLLQVLFKGECVRGLGDDPLCKAAGQVGLLQPDGSVDCVCEEGFLPSSEGDSCYPPLTRGLCEDDQG